MLNIFSAIEIKEHCGMYVAWETKPRQIEPSNKFKSVSSVVIIINTLETLICPDSKILPICPAIVKKSNYTLGRKKQIIVKSKTMNETFYCWFYVHVFF